MLAILMFSINLLALTHTFAYESIIFTSFHFYHWGASIKYVRAEGEGGRQRNDQFLRTIVLIGCVKSVQDGGGGPKSRKFGVRT